MQLVRASAEKRKKREEEAEEEAREDREEEEEKGRGESRDEAGPLEAAAARVHKRPLEKRREQDDSRA